MNRFSGDINNNTCGYAGFFSSELSGSSFVGESRPVFLNLTRFSISLHMRAVLEEDKV